MKQNCNNVHDNTSASVTAADNVIVISYSDTNEATHSWYTKERKSKVKKRIGKFFSALNIYLKKKHHNHVP